MPTRETRNASRDASVPKFGLAMNKIYRPSWVLGLIGIVFGGFAIAMFVSQVVLTESQDAVAFCVGSIVFLLIGAALLLYVCNTTIVVEQEGLVFKNILRQVTTRIPWDLVTRVTTATDEWTDSDGHQHRSTGYYVQAAGLGLVRISFCTNVQGLIRDIEAHAPRVRNDPLSTHTYSPASNSALSDDMGA